MSRSCHFCIPGYNSPDPLDVFRILRVAFLKPSNPTSVSSPGETAACTDYPSIWPLTYETFVPEMVRQKETSNSIRERMERMRETFSKVVAFLRISGWFIYNACANKHRPPHMIGHSSGFYLLFVLKRIDGLVLKLAISREITVCASSQSVMFTSNTY